MLYYVEYIQPRSMTVTFNTEYEIPPRTSSKTPYSGCVSEYLIQTRTVFTARAVFRLQMLGVGRFSASDSSQDIKLTSADVAHCVWNTTSCYTLRAQHFQFPVQLTD